MTTGTATLENPDEKHGQDGDFDAWELYGV